ncbi:hypothetical protein [Methylobacterium symbioticum]|uniref:Uncharacterized protein n=1 Tax=Methylobacterium symbioticum TaxID=2584084 RepID=A0A509EAP9_9HYPH|nr:hypothetical protein [Methylobacterium symbioticum]VUD71208.1 hypothetical protein MET9862_01785 [Methylobacterium symbioticum]
MAHHTLAPMTTEPTLGAEAVLLSDEVLEQVSAGDLFGVVHHTMGTIIGGILTVTGDTKNGQRLLTHQPKLLVKNVKELFNSSAPTK